MGRNYRLKALWLKHPALTEMCEDIIRVTCRVLGDSGPWCSRSDTQGPTSAQHCTQPGWSPALRCPPAPGWPASPHPQQPGLPSARTASFSGCGCLTVLSPCGSNPLGMGPPPGSSPAAGTEALAPQWMSSHAPVNTILLCNCSSPRPARLHRATPNTLTGHPSPG